MQDLKERTHKFGLRIIKFVEKLPHNNYVTRSVGEQLLRSGTSIGANLEEAYSGWTKKDFNHSLNISRKECFESRYWVKLLLDAGFVKKEDAFLVLDEIEHLIKIFTAILKKTRPL